MYKGRKIKKRKICDDSKTVNYLMLQNICEQFWVIVRLSQF